MIVASAYFYGSSREMGGDMNECGEVSSQLMRLHRSLKGNDAASLRRVAPAFLFIQATLCNVAALICSRLSDISGGQEGVRGKSPFDSRLGKSAFAPLSAGESGFLLACTVCP